MLSLIQSEVVVSHGWITFFGVRRHSGYIADDPGAYIYKLRHLHRIYRLGRQCVGFGVGYVGCMRPLVDIHVDSFAILR